MINLQEILDECTPYYQPGHYGIYTKMWDKKDIEAIVKRCVGVAVDEMAENVDRYAVYNDGFGILVDDNEVEKLKQSIVK